MSENEPVPVVRICIHVGVDAIFATWAPFRATTDLTIYRFIPFYHFVQQVHARGPILTQVPPQGVRPRKWGE